MKNVHLDISVIRTTKHFLVWFHDLDTYMEEAGLVTYTAASHQVVIKTLRIQEAVMSTIFISLYDLNTF